MTRRVIGVIGHVDHGKTALAGALTGMETDRLPEERQRGISIALGFAHFSPAPGIVIDLIDMPGHERFVRTMVAGATGIDAVLLVVAANEGVMPQTVEHIDIAGLLGVQRAVVAVTKADLVSPDEADFTGEEAAALLREAGIAVERIVLTSAQTGQGMADLGAALAALATGPARPRPDGLPFLPIDRAFTMTGHGTVITGTLRGAAITTGDMLELLPARRRVRVRGVQVHGQAVDSADPGQRVAVNLRGAGLDEVERGMALSTPAAIEPSDWLTVALRTVESAPPLRNGMRLRALFGTAEIDVRLRLLDRDELAPGTEALAQLRCARPAAIPAREHVILRLPSPARTVAGGVVLEPFTHRLKRMHPPVLARLALLRDRPPVEVLAAEIGRAGARGVMLPALSRLTGLAGWRIAELLKPLPVIIGRDGLVLPAREVERKRRTLAPKADPARETSDAELGARIAEAMRQAGLQPPRPDEIIRDAASHRAVQRLLRQGVLLRCVDRGKGKDMLFHREAITHAQAVLRPLLADEATCAEGLLVTEIAAALGISRKFCMPLIDQLDTMRFTRREGDRRVLNTC